MDSRILSFKPIKALRLLSCFGLLLFGILNSHGAAAITYDFPTNLPPGCSGSGGTYTCNIDFQMNYDVTFSDTGNVTINHNGDYRLGSNYSVGTTSQTANVTINIVDPSGSTNLDLYSGTNVYANLNLTTSSSIRNIDITMNGTATVHGDITANGQDHVSVNLYDNSVINGNLDTYGPDSARIWLRSNVRVNGDVSATSVDIDDGDIEITDPTVTVTGNVTAFGDLRNAGVITGCALISDTNSGAQLRLDSGSSTGSICKGTPGSCAATSSYLINNTGTTPPNCAATPVNATLIAKYHLEEESWNGTTNEVKDTAGFTGGPFDGQAILSPIPTASTSTPARVGQTGTCGYAAFASSTSGAEFELDNLPTVTSTGSKTTVSFWMYWDGTNGLMPIAWSSYDLYFDGSGNFGFNTLNSDLYGISSSGLANRWVHVTAVFTNGDVTGNALYIDGVKQTLTQIKGSPNNTNAVVQNLLTVGGISSRTGHSFINGYLDEVKVYNGEMTQAQVTADYNATHACPEVVALVAHYHLDEESWNGTANEVKDTAGFTGGPFDGLTVGTPKPIATNTAPAIAGTSGTCGYAELDGPTSGGGAIRLTNVPINTSTDSKNSLSFWMYWDGTDNVMPFSSGDYGLLVSNNKFGFTTDGVDVYGIDGASLANGWHHVAAVINQGDITANKLYIDGVLQTLSHQIGGPSNVRITKASLDGNNYPTGHQVPNAPWVSTDTGGRMEVIESNYSGIGGPIRKIFRFDAPFSATISTNVGDTVYVSFDHSEIHGSSFYADDFELYIDGNFIARVDRDATTFASYSYSGTTNSTSTVIEFRPDLNRTIAIDDILIETETIGTLTGSLSTTLQLGGSTNDTSKRFTGRLDEIKLYRGEMSQAQVSADKNAVHTCPSYVTNTVSSGFNCVAPGASSDTGHLYLQKVGTPFTVDVVALKTDRTVENGFAAASNQNVTVELVNGAGTTACASRALLSPAISQTLTFASTDAGRKSIPITVNKAYRDIRCRVTDANQSPVVVGCSSDNFAVKPAALTVSATSANADATGAYALATPTIKTGANFTLTVSAGAGYDGTPSIDPSKLSPHSGAVQTGTLTGAFGTATATNGAANGTFQYSEVGYFQLLAQGIYDDGFSAVDSANGDCAPGAADSGGLYGCRITHTAATQFFGRFTPDHFTVSNISSTPACGSFNYYGQESVSTGFTLTAQNNAGDTTQNYTGDYDHLVLSSWSSTTGLRFSASGLTAGSLASGTVAPSGSWSNGVANITATHTIARDTSPMAPADVTIMTQPIDMDTITTTSPIALASNVPFRYGRVTMSNVYGSELRDLRLMIEAQYWDGNTYRRNTLDSCTTVSIGDFLLGNYAKNLNAGETTLTGGGLMNQGLSTLTLSKPGPGNNGSVDLSLSLLSLPWFDAGVAPVAKATFGIHKTPFIYMRESF